MDEREWLAEQFEANRTHLRAVAYRMLGSVSEADDAVQESWLRLNRSDAGGVENLRAWLTTVVARVCLDMLRSRKSRREEALGPHVPEPIVSREDGVDPEHEALLADSVGLALLVVLETLSSRRAARVRAARHVRRAVRRDRSDRRPLPGRGAAAREPGATPGTGRRPGARRRSHRASERSSTPSWPPLAAVTSRRSSRSSIPMSCSASTAAPCGRARRGRSEARGLSPSRSAASRGSLAPPGRRLSTEPPGSSWLRTGGRSRWPASRSRAARSSRSTCSPTLRACVRST